jgi:xanthine dehydrogenase YagS FAD-binding subunit
MKFKSYLYPKNIAEASELLANKNELNFVNAGGTDLLGLLKEKIITADNLVNIKNIDNLKYIRHNVSGETIIGALTKLSDIIEDEGIKKKYPVLYQAAGETASPQLRNVGTLGGNLCQRPRCIYFRGDFNCLRKGGDTCFAYDGLNKYHCLFNGGPCFIVNPSDLAPALISLGAFITIYSNGVEKEIPLKDFYILPSENYLKETKLEKGDIVTKIRIPAQKGNIKSMYIKIKERGAWDFALVSIAACLDIKGTTLIGGKLTFGGVSPAPFFSDNYDKNLAGLELSNRKAVEEYADSYVKEANPLQLNKYKVVLMKNLIIKLFSEIA